MSDEKMHKPAAKEILATLDAETKDDLFYELRFERICKAIHEKCRVFGSKLDEDQIKHAAELYVDDTRHLDEFDEDSLTDSIDAVLDEIENDEEDDE